jgi:hypothetical protein
MFSPAGFRPACRLRHRLTEALGIYCAAIAAVAW